MLTVAALDNHLAESGSAIYVYAIITTPDNSLFYAAGANQTVGFYGTNTTRALYQWCLKSVSSISVGIDPFERTYQDSDCELELIDEGTSVGFRAFMAAHRVLSASVQVRFCFRLTDLGSVSNTVSAPYWSGLVRDVIPGEGTFVLRCSTQMRLALQQETGKHYFNRHPLELIDDLLTDAGVPAASINSTSLTASTWTDISHFVVSTSVYETGENMSSARASGRSRASDADYSSNIKEQ
jgi:hypothetical protein